MTIVIICQYKESEVKCLPVMEREPGQALAKEKQATFGDIFQDLPVKAGLNVWEFSKLVPEDADFGLMRRQVNDKYLDLLLKRQNFGFPKFFEVDREIAFSLLSSELFEQITAETEQKAHTLTVARHEIGHALVARNLNWSVPAITVVPNGYYLGLTESSPPSGLTFKDWLLTSAAISYGGKIAAIMSGDKASGTGADMASVEAKANMAVTMGFYSSTDAFCQEAEGMASGALKSAGPSLLNRQALNLLEKQTLV